jgi:hypothetical protein
MILESGLYMNNIFIKKKKKKERSSCCKNALRDKSRERESLSLSSPTDEYPAELCKVIAAQGKYFESSNHKKIETKRSRKEKEASRTHPRPLDDRELSNAKTAEF